jgi:hypothetical protein
VARAALATAQILWYLREQAGFRLPLLFYILLQPCYRRTYLTGDVVMTPAENAPQHKPQINVRFDREQFHRIDAIARTHHLSAIQFCRELILKACATDQTGQPTAVRETPPLKTSQAIADLTAKLDEITRLQLGLIERLDTTTRRCETNSLATLEQVLAVRLILQNLAAATFTGQGEMAELRALANDSAPQLASEILADLAARLSDGAGTDTHPDTEPERSTTNG